MPVYAAFLRGINVGGHRSIPMARLRGSLGALGLEDVRSYIQSGNVVFRSGKRSVSALRSELEQAIEAEFGYDVVVMIRTPAELARIIDDAPFDALADAEEWRTSVALLTQAPAPAAARALLSAANDEEHFVVHGADVYARSRRAVQIRRPVPLERILGVPATVRNWNTMLKMREISASPSPAPPADTSGSRFHP